MMDGYRKRDNYPYNIHDAILEFKAAYGYLLESKSGSTNTNLNLLYMTTCVIGDTYWKQLNNRDEGLVWYKKTCFYYNTISTANLAELKKNTTLEKINRASNREIMFDTITQISLYSRFLDIYLFDNDIQKSIRTKQKIIDFWEKRNQNLSEKEHVFVFTSVPMKKFLSLCSTLEDLLKRSLKNEVSSTTTPVLATPVPTTTPTPSSVAIMASVVTSPSTTPLTPKKTTSPETKEKNAIKKLKKRMKLFFESEKEPIENLHKNLKSLQETKHEKLSKWNEEENKIIKESGDFICIFLNSQMEFDELCEKQNTRETLKKLNTLKDNLHVESFEEKREKINLEVWVAILHLLNNEAHERIMRGYRYFITSRTPSQTTPALSSTDLQKNKPIAFNQI